MSNLYIKCELCSNEFSRRYFSQHSCYKKSLSKPQQDLVPDTQLAGVQEDVAVDTDLNNVNNANSPTDDPSINSGNLSDEDIISADDVAQEMFHDFFQESAFFYNNDLTANDNCKEAMLVRWICLFLAHWQYLFNITDTALEFVIKFISVFLKALQDSESKFISTVSDIFPGSLYSFRKFLSIGGSKFKKYVVCIKCNSLFELNECSENYRGEKVSRKCSFVKYPNHRLQHMRKKCGQLLMKDYKSPSGENILYPFKTYCYVPLKESLELLLARDNFESDCNKWRTMSRTDELLTDVYDGKIWKNFSQNGQLYFDNPCNFALMLNLDWFQPFKHLSSFSIGGVYLVVLNLPRSERFKRKNVILSGIIPNMSKEPPTNTYMQPLVDELNVGWHEGFTIRSINGNTHNEKCYRVALICIGCDIPACRKLCGFLGHSASQGCSKCNKTFPGMVGQKDYGGFDEASWEPRSTEKHREQMEEILECETVLEKERLESRYGTRYSVFAQLEYYDTVRMAIIDPMHNLFLGTAKKMLKIWKDKGYLERDSLQQLQEKVDSFVVPGDVGKIPRKIVSCFDGFTADEYKNWTLLFSIYCLKGIVPDEDIKCFQNFVLACQYLCQRIISKRDVMVAHGLLMKFCTNFQQRYGTDKVTPNMHLHGHIKDCILDFGPIYGFWLFSFERYNGILGSLPNNKKDIEPQIMRRFCNDNSILNLKTSTEYESMFKPLIIGMESLTHQRGTLSDMECEDLVHVAKLSSRLCNPSLQVWSNNTYITSKRFTVGSLSSIELTNLKQTYKCLYPLVNHQTAVVSPSYQKAFDVCVAGEMFGSKMSRSSRSSYIIAYWAAAGGKIQKFDGNLLFPRPGVIQFFLKHVLVVEGNSYNHWFAYCEWFLPVPDNMKEKFGKPVEVWQRSLYENTGAASFIPVARIRSKFVFANYCYKSRDLMVVIPRIRHSII